MLNTAQREDLEVVLVSPRNPLNIGAAARAMANFGFARLTVVAPYEEHWREARSAVGAEALLENARRTQCLAEAVATCTLAIGTGTAGHRRPEQPLVALPALGQIVKREMEGGGRVALVFGSEKRGLTREDLALCHVLAEIPTEPQQPSMNLGQAVAVCLYELAARGDLETATPQADAPAVQARESDVAAASSSDLDLLAGLVSETMEAASYSPAAMRRANRHDLQLLLRRLRFEGRDARRAMGLFRRILWRMQHPGGPEGDGETPGRG